MKRILPGPLIAYAAVISALLTAGRTAATPYATSLTNAAGTVSFRLNQTTATNDTVLVISGNGAVTNTLQSPSTDPTKVLARGLIQTNLGIAAGPIKIYIKHVGAGVISTNSPRFTFNSPRGISVNTRPDSPFFGWVYVGNSVAGTQGEGLFAFRSDFSDPFGQGNAARTAGYNFTTALLNDRNPFHLEVAPDDSVIVSDWSDSSGGVIAVTPDLTSFQNVLKPLVANPPATLGQAPVGPNNNHGSISDALIVGSGANRVLYTMDEDYQTDPSSGVVREWNSIWRYDIGNATFPYADAPARKIFTPYLGTFAGQNQSFKIAGHYLYANQRRSNPPQYSAYVVDLNNLQDPNTFNGTTPWGHIWNSQDASIQSGYSDDVLRDAMAVAVSPDGKWFAGIIAASGTAITQPDGTVYTAGANELIVMPITNGIPNIAAKQHFRPGGVSLGRGVAFDSAHNLYYSSSGVLAVQSLDIGESGEAITGSDGTFEFVTPVTQVSVAASTPLATEQGTVPGVITFTRTPEDIANPETIFYSIAGTAVNGVDYVAITNFVTIPANQTTADLLITPINDTITELSETVIITVRGSGNYSVGFPVSATVGIADNETPQLRILSLSTNLYQGNPNDYVQLRLRRFGDTNVDLTLNANSFALGGTAVSNVDYYLTNLPFTIAAGVVDANLNLIGPRNTSTEIGNRSITVTNLAGAGYTVSNNTAATTLTLKGQTAGPVLFSEDFENVSAAANWDVFFAAFGDQSPDYTVEFNYNYAQGGLGNLGPIPPAPHSTAGGTRGLFLTVNKGDENAASAALNLYLKNMTFSGSYAVRFDMFLVQNSSGAQQTKNETAMFGINHSGTKTNWVRNSIPGTGAAPNKFDSDGIFATVEADASTTLNFAFWSGPTWTNTVGVVGPTNFLAKRSTTLLDVFKRPPFNAGPAAGGVPANTVVSPTPTWVTVEISQIENVITWKMDNIVILSFVNTNANTTNVTSGKVMLGYNDPWDDIANGSANSGEAAVIFDNLSVVTIAVAPKLTVASTPTGASLTFPSQSGITYAIEWKSDVASATWNPLSTIPGTGGVITVPLATQPDAVRFFRVRVQ